ncbi:tRNA(Met) cytidine acetyltransferase TmcA [Thalassotalea crassostreae]|uniref:tRNA(Met) cytidine acetyltransferase TmcA n=1 Tax=Thalassotalea crassostreae TaxID=1763536 RepID=UPI000AAFBC3B|nr:GNAT family N-acetyltransferase [Thalassotalea crassostreae]
MNNYLEYFSKSHVEFSAQRLRGTLLIQGDETWLKEQLAEVFLALKTRTILHFSNSESNGNIEADNRNFKQFLGQEHDVLVFEAEQHFNVDAFAALSGTLVAGGHAIVVLPEPLISSSLFCQRFIQIAKTYDNVDFVCPQSPLSLQRLPNTKKNEPIAINQLKQVIQDQFSDDFKSNCVTAEQAVAVEKIIQVLTGHRDRPLILTADRGRGKSSALAIAVVELLKKQDKRIIISAPHPDSLSVFFNQIQHFMPNSKRTGNQVFYGSSVVEFIAIDALVKHQPSCHLLLIDEAAGIPLPQLRQLLGHYHRQVFVSTVHGYEGAGRGFSTKFVNEVKHTRPNANLLHIKQPIRWAENDPLERFSFDALLLNAKLADAKQAQLSIQSINDIDHQYISAQQLSSDEPLLRRVFALLVTAHYQTKPSDLMMLLDNPKVSLIVQSTEQQLVGVALLLAEGQIDDELSGKVKQSVRRIKGHLIPQSLLVHSGIEDAFEYSYQRIVRIAIHPQLQGQSLGHQLLEYCHSYSQRLGCDFVASSFGANKQLLKFWLDNQFSTCRIGFTKDNASGEHSAIVLRAISDKARQLQAVISKRFYNDLIYYLADEYQHLATGLVALILTNQSSSSHLDENDIEAVHSFQAGFRVFSSCAPALQRWLLATIVNKGPDWLDNKVVEMMIAKLLQKHDWQTLANDYSYTGKKTIHTAMKRFVSEHV